MSFHTVDLGACVYIYVCKGFQQIWKSNKGKKGKKVRTSCIEEEQNSRQEDRWEDTKGMRQVQRGKARERGGGTGGEKKSEGERSERRRMGGEGGSE